jgi:hypothetical protein
MQDGDAEAAEGGGQREALIGADDVAVGRLEAGGEVALGEDLSRRRLGALYVTCRALCASW